MTSGGNEDQSAQTRIRFDWFALRRAHFVDPFAQEAPQRPFPRLLIEMELAESMDDKSLTARVQLAAILKPDPDSDPVLNVMVEGQFAASSPSDEAHFRTFIQSHRAASLLFPFLRERVHSLTAHTRGSGIMLPLIDTVSVFRQVPAS